MLKFSFSLLRLLAAILALEYYCFPAKAQVPASSLRGYLYVHDPSTITYCEGRYYVFYTGQGIQSKSSADKIYWTEGPPIFSNAPAWTSNAVPGFTGLFWAPDVLYFNNLYHLWYAVSTFGSQVSAIGLVTSPTLNPADPNYHWTDQGPVIQSTNGSPYNTIDPSFCWDASGNLWMAFGSYWNGIYLVQLNATNGLRIASNSPTYNLAYNSSIEASYLFKRGGYYYLWANWGSCCDGVDSTYNIRMGRATSITGPYLDENGVDMVDNGGSLFQQASGKFTGPGHVGILSSNGTQLWSYHYYDANQYAPQYGDYGEPALSVEPLSWTSNNWPVFSNNWTAIYHFQADARDDNGQYYGLLKNGATVETNSAYGHALNLNGSNQWAWLPPGAAYGQTFVAVVNWHGGADWQRIFDFGVNTSATVLLTPASGDNVLRCDINPGGNLQTMQWTNPLPSNVWTHVAVTFSGSQGVIYVNGMPVVTNTSMTFLPLNVAPQSNALGQSKFTVDPYFNGQYAAFRVYSSCLTPQQILQPVPEIIQPASGSSYWPGSAINYAGEATDFAALPLAPGQLSWEIEYSQDGVTNVVYGPVTGTNGTYSIPTNATGGGSYIVVLTATDNSNRQCTVTSTLLPANPPPGWSSYYSLKANAKDINGHYNGTLQGGATFANDPTRGEVLSLNGVNQYVSFPPGLSGMQTFMAWVKWNGGAEWQRIYDFGNNTNFYSVLTPAASSGDLRFNISVDSIPGEQIIDAPGPLPTGVWTHVAVVMTGMSVVLYTNGVPIGTNLYANLVPENLNATNIYIGKSQWPADPYFGGEMSDVRIFSYPLASNQITAPQITIAQPQQGMIYKPGTYVFYNGSANDFYDNSIAASGLTWRVNYINAGVTTTVSGPWAGITNGSYLLPAVGSSSTNGYYQIVLSATDTNGRVATNAVSIYPAASVGQTNWSSFYPFTNSAQDSSNLYNGTLVGGPAFVSDPTRGRVLSLSGSGEYVSLPAGASSAQTISGWVKWYGGSEWERIFDFGQNDTDYFFLTTADSSNLIQSSITTDVNIYNQETESTSAFPINRWAYFSVVMDGREEILYINGNAVAVNNSANLLPSDVGASYANLGKSSYASDPYFYGLMSSFALNSGPLLPNQLVLPFAVVTLPTNGALYTGGTSLAFAGAGTDYAGNPLPAASFSWSGQFYSNGVVTPAFGPLAGVTNGSFQIPTNISTTTNAYYVINLTVTDTNNNMQSAVAVVFPEPAPAAATTTTQPPPVPQATKPTINPPAPVKAPATVPAAAAPAAPKQESQVIPAEKKTPPVAAVSTPAVKQPEQTTASKPTEPPPAVKPAEPVAVTPRTQEPVKPADPVRPTPPAQPARPAAGAQTPGQPPVRPATGSPPPARPATGSPPGGDAPRSPAGTGNTRLPDLSGRPMRNLHTPRQGGGGGGQGGGGGGGGQGGGNQGRGSSSSIRPQRGGRTPVIAQPPQQQNKQPPKPQEPKPPQQQGGLRKLANITPEMLQGMQGKGDAPPSVTEIEERIRRQEQQKHGPRLTTPAPGAAPPLPPVGDEEESESDRRRRGAAAGSGVPGRAERHQDRAARQAKRKLQPDDSKGGGKISTTALLEEDERGSRRKDRRPKVKQPPTVKRKGKIPVTLPITVRSLSESLGRKHGEVMTRLIGHGAPMATTTINSFIEPEMAELVALDLGLELDIKRGVDEEGDLIKHHEKQDAPEDLVPRAPVVTIMGHVDHGKTSLLDRIRHSNVVDTEAGGITQVIRAWRVEHDGKPVTFLDTPGHEAFTKMRARGANVTDIAVIVVAANDGVMPQTEEAISHAKAAGVAIVVAINKVDLPDANLKKTEQQLYGLGLVPDNMGGDVPFVYTSARSGKGIDDLLENLSVVAEVMELKANPNKSASGTCLEAHLSEKEGVFATILVQDGTLRPGDVVLCGSTYGTIRRMYDDRGRPLEEAGPSVPVRITGLDEVPNADDPFLVVESLTTAREIAETRKDRQLAKAQFVRSIKTIEDLKTIEIAELKVILKAEARGSIEAIKAELEKLHHEEVRVRILHAAIGGITVSDVQLALTSPHDTMIVGFNVVPDNDAKALAEERGVQIREYDIIFKLSEDIRSALEGKLKPREDIIHLGRAVVRKTFKIGRVGTVAGCHVTQGHIERSGKVRIIRSGVVVYPPADRTVGLDSLKRVKEDVREVREGFECGIKIAGYDDIKVDDVIECYRIEQVQRTLN